jgi:hypothetical protein
MEVINYLACGLSGADVAELRLKLLILLASLLDVFTKCLDFIYEDC